ncbi:dynein heavy chain and region D6 of dynein motor-domain-containing protein [Paraphysoderma sedebokerense]|nr:dynein heavy chain and region D6 of dynein motor-domain-containing protein [Paraphysoderma sedebokerense]
MVAHPETKNNFIPLEFFDDTEYDTRVVDEWLNMDKETTSSSWAKDVHSAQKQGYQEASVHVPCRTYVDGFWADGNMIGYDRSAFLWKIKIDNGSVSKKSIAESKTLTTTPTEVMKPRIYVHFLAEDPYHFANRIRAACKLRSETEAKLKYNFYIDCMPKSSPSLLPVSSYTKSIVDRSVLRMQNLKNLVHTETTRSLVEEIEHEYGRAMNKILFNHETRDPANSPLYSHLALPETEVDIARLSYETSFYGEKPAVGLIRPFYRVIPKPEKSYVFSDRRKSFSFESFLTKSLVCKTWYNVRIECNRIGSMSFFSTNLHKMMRHDEFEQQQSQSIHQIKLFCRDNWATGIKNIIKSGLKDIGKGWYSISENNFEVYKISKLKRFMTTVRFILQDSLRFLLIHSFQEYIKLIRSTVAYKITIEGTNLIKVFERIPESNPRKPIFMLDLVYRDGKITYDTDLQVYEKTLITVLEKSLTAIDSVSDLEPLIMDKLSWASKPLLETVHSIRDVIKEALLPLEHYLRQYDKYINLARTDLNNKSLTVGEMENDIIRHQQDHVSIGMFHINCESIRNGLRKDFSKVVLESLSIISAFQQIQLRLKERPSKVEEMSALRDYMKMQARIKDMLHDYEILDKYKYELPNDNFKAKWAACGWPAQIDKTMKQTEENLNADEQNFLRLLLTDQELFKERIHHISAVITNFSKHTDLNRLQEIIAEECQSLVDLYNSRERIFGIEITNYEDIANLSKDFEPYRTLWMTTNDWFKWKSSCLSSEEIEKNLTSGWRSIFKCCLAVANQIKDEMEEFKPYLPLIQALCNPGMRDRHWDKLSAEVGIRMRPSESFSLTDLLSMNLMKHLDKITKVCDEAAKEFSIEATLDKMEKEWKDTGTFIMKTSDELIRLLDDHIKPFADRIALWDSKLRVIQEPIFASEDIIRQLPNESKRWRRIMQQAKSKSRALDVCLFRESNKALELVSKGLIAFPRFFFLSDDELLQILSQTRDPTAFQSDKLITAMYASDGECIPFPDKFYPMGNVEEWLLKVEEAMKKSIREEIKKCLADYWVLEWAGQDVTEAIRGNCLDKLYKQQLNQLENLVKLVRSDLPEIARLSLGALIVIDQLIETKVSSAADFEWMSQLRYYWEDNDLRVKIVNANFKYGYEYLGNTDRCYLTLSGAMHLAGTGKTETCVVFNCSDQLDYLAMAKFFKGLAAAGAWACFDEFNRIDIEQITTIQKAVAAGMTRFVFEGADLGLDPTNAIFITMNPDNLKALFRPVAMMIPDYAMIAEITQKMVATFKLSSEQLSSQDHYDFGMRAVKTREQPNAPEDLLLLRALCDDVPLFNGIISDLFPGVQQPKADYGELLSMINEMCAEMHLQPEEPFIKKCIQMYETTVVRHGMMLVGPTGVLAAALTNGTVFERVRTHVVNPKSITMGQLYGEFDPQTHEWTDGAEDTTADKKWYIFDGPVDAIWIESMNTVLDDNKKLCLSMFEVENLAYASPATVSPLGLSPLITSCFRTTFNNTLRKLYSTYLHSSLEFLRKNLKETLTQSLMKIFDSLLVKYTDVTDLSSNVPAEKESALNELVEPLFIFSLIWSIGVTSDSDGRLKFNSWLREKLQVSGQNVSLPKLGVIYDYRFDFESKQWVNWMAGMSDFAVNSKTGGSDVIVPTMDNIRHSYLLDILLHNNCHVLCTGPTGTGKTVTINDKIFKGMKEIFSPLIVNFSARTSANQTQDLLDSKFEKRRKGVYGPPVGKKFVVFVDDLNMPAMESTGAQPPIEFLRQWMDHNGWYDRKVVGKFMEVVDIVYAAAMGPPGGGRNPITQRLLRHFNLISFVEMDEPSLNRIFNTIISSFTSKLGTDIQNITSLIVQASIHVYNTIRKELLPTPAKSHYTYNLRDLAKVFQGIMGADIKSLAGSSDFVRLWIHECLRVFSDRLVDKTDRAWFTDLLKPTIQEYLRVSWNDVIRSEPVIYCDYLTPGADPKCYVEVKDMKRLVKLVEEYLEDYNSQTNAPMKLVMFLDAIEHVSRICRILRQPRGNGLLLGVGGSGRQSLARLAAFMSEYECFQIEISKNYGQTEWREDLKKVLFKAGLDLKPTMFLYCDTQIVDESCLEDVNSILNSGDVPNIYNQEELNRIYQAMRPVAVEANLPPTKENMFAMYVDRIRENLHVILCMSPIGEAFRNRLRMFPSLVNCCTIDWFSMWPEEALRSVAANSIAEMTDLGSENVIDGIVNLCVLMHESVRETSVQFKAELGRNNYITPTSYLQLLALYKKLLDKKRGDLQALRKRTATGLEKLLTATKEVEMLQEELEHTQPMLIQTSQETEDTMKRIAVDKVKSEEIREVVATEELAASKKAEETKAIADDAKRDLDEALPALDAALQSLNSLSKNDVIEVRSMQRPPEGVKLVMEAVCIMKGVKPKKIDGDKPGKKVDDYWEPGRGLLADPAKFLDSLMTYDKDNIPEAVIQKIKPYIDNPDFEVSVISKVSKAATSICAWVRAMEKYYWVSRAIEPKRARLKEAQESLDVTLKTLADLRQKLREAEVNIKEMEKKYTESVAKKEELGRKVEDCSIKLSRAGKLISGLGSEKHRWAQSVDLFDTQIGAIVGDVLVASGAIAYLGPFTSEYRSILMKGWIECLSKLKIPHSESFSLMDVIGDSAKIREWEMFGLPKDTLSRENAIIASNSKRWPLFIDPQGQANKWIRNMEKDSGIDIIKLTDKDYLRTLENSIRFGKPCLLENVQEKLDPALEPVLLRLTFKQSGNTVIKVGDSVLPYHEDFRLYITTKLPNPHYSPETSAIVTLLNFTLAPSGLEDQLLALVVAHERPDLEEAKNQLAASNAQMKKELKDIEDKILYLLSSVQGSPVDDERLIETLAASKVTSAEIASKVTEAEKTEKDIDRTRSGYTTVAVRTRILFFCITDLSTIDPMYQYSLNWFMNIFAASLSNSEKSDNLQQRLTHVIDYFTFSLFCNVCRSLFEKHKLLFSFLLAVKILMNEGRINADEWKFLLTGGTASDHQIPNPASDWLASRSWTDILSLSKLTSFQDLAEGFSRTVDDFRRLYDSAHPHREILPDKWATSLDAFQKLLVLRCLRTDRVVSGIQDFVASTLGQKFIEPQTSEFSAIFKESNPWTPFVFVLSPGADPASNLYKFAEEMRFSKKLASVSLGQGQGPRAEALIREGMDKGMWTLLQNCHLAPSWMPTLDKLVDGITPDKVHRDFRLWLTSMPTPKFPVSILQNGVKMTVEPPKGVKANLLRTYATFNDEFLSSCSKSLEWKRLLFSLGFFHAVVQERRKFGPLGFNIPYEFTDGDLQICIRQLKLFLEENDDIPFKVLKYTVGHINYGGRVTDDWDRRLIMSILDDFYNPAVLENNHKYSTSPLYYNPAVNDYSAYKSYIKGLPLDEPTEIFLMHSNANITFAQKETFTLFETLLTLMPKSSSSKGGKTREDHLIETVTSIAQKVPKPIPTEMVSEKYPIDYKESMSTVLIQEIVRYNRVLALIHSTLQDLIKALKGFVVMSEQLETMANSIFINQIPAIWSAKAYPSLKPLSSWISDLVKRIEFFQNWIDNGIPNVFWISGFFFPQAFLTATMQNYARKYGLPIDTLSFEHRIVDTKWSEIENKPPDGCYIRGLYLEGARWDPVEKVLADGKPKELYTDMPVIWLLPKQNLQKPETDIYDCPCYKTIARAGTLSTTGHSTNYILTIELPTNLPQSYWIKRGVALICSGNW